LGEKKKFLYLIGVTSSVTILCFFSSVTVVLLCGGLVVVRIHLKCRIALVFLSRNSHRWGCPEFASSDTETLYIWRVCSKKWMASLTSGWWRLVLINQVMCNQGRNNGSNGAQQPGRQIYVGRRKISTISQVLSSIQYICTQKTFGQNMEAPNLFPVPGSITLGFAPLCATCARTYFRRWRRTTDCETLSLFAQKLTSWFCAASHNHCNLAQLQEVENPFSYWRDHWMT